MVVRLREFSGEPAVVIARGEIDMDNAGSIRQAVANMLRPGLSRIVIDLGEVTFFGSAGIHSLIEAHALAAEAGCPLVVVNVQPMTRRVLEIAGLIEMLEMSASPRSQRVPDTTSISHGPTKPSGPSN